MGQSSEPGQQGPAYPSTEGQSSTGRCHWHPNVETSLFCGRCGKSICTQCMVQAPVGIRCRECGKSVPMPTFDVTPSYYARAAGAALAWAIGGGVLWGLAGLFLRGIPFVSSIAAMLVGYAAGEIISLAVNRKRGTGLAWIAAGTVVAAYVISLVISSQVFSIWALVFIGFGIYLAVTRVR